MLLALSARLIQAGAAANPQEIVSSMPGVATYGDP